MPLVIEVSDVAVRIRERRTELGDGDRLAVETVFCPIQRRSVPCSGCSRCERLVGESIDVISCSLETDTQRCAAETVTVSQVMPALVTCVDCDLGFEELVQLIEERGLTAVPVVEDEGVLLGLVTRKDLKSATPPEHFGTYEVELTAEDVMKSHVPTLSETASLLEAIDALAAEDVDALPVVAANGVVVGLVTSVDVLRWLGSHADLSP